MGHWQLEARGKVALLTLARPPVNALDHDALVELERTLGDVASAGGIGALVVASRLPGVFCAGGDLRHWRTITDGRRVGDSGRRVFERLAHLELPTLAALDGSVVGDGLGLALACDLRIASERMTVRLPELGYGFIPGWGTLGRLVDVVGRAEAAHLLLTGSTCHAADALRVRLVHRLVPQWDEVVPAALDLASRLAAASPQAMRAARRALRAQDERECFRQVWGGADWEEGIDALFGKRAPRFGARKGVAG